MSTHKGVPTISYIRKWIVNGRCMREMGVDNKYRLVPCDLPYACDWCPYNKDKERHILEKEKVAFT